MEAEIRGRGSQSLVVKDFLSNSKRKLRRRLGEFQSQPEREYIDNLTNIEILNSLTLKRAEEVAYNLVRCLELHLYYSPTMDQDIKN